MLQVAFCVVEPKAQLQSIVVDIATPDVRLTMLYREISIAFPLKLAFELRFQTSSPIYPMVPKEWESPPTNQQK